MNPLKWLCCWLFGSKLKYVSKNNFQCNHRRRPKQNIHVLVRGEKLSLKSSPFCADCTETYFNRYAGTCAICGKAITPGEPVGVAPLEAPFGGEVTHLTMECSPFPGLFCGHWGEGELEPVNWEHYFAGS